MKPSHAKIEVAQVAVTLGVATVAVGAIRGVTVAATVAVVIASLAGNNSHETKALEPLTKNDRKGSRDTLFTNETKEHYEFLSTGPRAHTSERLRVSRSQHTHANSTSGNTDHSYRRRRDWLCRNGHR